MGKISPFLWFNDNAEAAANFYVSIFPNSRKLDELRTGGEPSTGRGGSVLTVRLELDGQPVTFLNGGPHHQLTEAFSFVIACENQAEIDGYWEKFGDGGKELGCGWIKDKFGLCWQVVPSRIGQLLRNPAAFKAMMSMKKLDIAALESAKL